MGINVAKAEATTITYLIAEVDTKTGGESAT